MCEFLNSGAPCICIFSPGVQPQIPPCGITFLFSTSQPKYQQPTLLQLPSCLLSILTCTSIHRSLVCNWPLIYRWRPPPNRHRHCPQSLHIRVPIRPWTVLYLRTSLPKSHLHASPSQHRYCHDPMSYISFPPPLPGELGNPPCAAPDMPILTQSSNLVLISPLEHPPRLEDARSAHLYTHIPSFSSTAPSNVPSTCVRVRVYLRH